jgi:hypothetical protein
MNQPRHRSFASFRFVAVSIASAFLILAAVSSSAQRKPGATEETPAYNEYRGVQLGMAAADVRKKLGDPREKSAGQDFFVFNESEMAQVIYDKTEKVITISADFMGPKSAAPTAKDVFGAEIEAKPDGSMHKMMRFPKAGYWLSYNRTGGTDAVITIQLQKLP